MEYAPTVSSKMGSQSRKMNPPPFLVDNPLAWHKFMAEKFVGSQPTAEAM